VGALAPTVRAKTPRTTLTHPLIRADHTPDAARLNEIRTGTSDDARECRGCFGAMAPSLDASRPSPCSPFVGCLPFGEPHGFAGCRIRNGRRYGPSFVIGISDGLFWLREPRNRNDSDWRAALKSLFIALTRTTSLSCRDLITTQRADGGFQPLPPGHCIDPLSGTRALRWLLKKMPGREPMTSELFQTVNFWEDVMKVGGDRQSTVGDPPSRLCGQ
jgi:hypothetical protein